MKIEFRHGILSAPSGYLKLSDNNRYVDLRLDGNDVLASIADGEKDYLISENASVSDAWGPFENLLTNYLYWDIDTKTAEVTRGFTFLPLIISSEKPSFARKDQMWWDSTTNTMNVYDGVTWKKVIRVFAGKIQGRKNITEETVRSQVNLNTPSVAGYILFENGSPLKNKNDEFLTSDVTLSIENAATEVDDNSLKIIAQEPIAKYDIISIHGGKASLASGTFDDDATNIPFSMAANSANQGEVVTIFAPGVVVENKEWNFQLENLGKPIYCDSTGKITFFKPNQFKNIKVGVVSTDNSIVLAFSTETDISNALKKLDEVDIDYIVKTHEKIDKFTALLENLQTEIETVKMTLKSLAFARHKHELNDVVGLDDAMKSKSNLSHTHQVEEVTGISSIVDNLANKKHSHSLADLSDVRGITAAKNYDNLTFDSSQNKWVAGNLQNNVKEISSPSYIVGLDDNGKILIIAFNSNCQITLPNNLPQGFSCSLIQMGDLPFTLIPAAGAIIDSSREFGFKLKESHLLVISNQSGINASYIIS